MTPETIVSTVERAYAEFLGRDRHPASPHLYTYASSFRDCERRMVLDAKQPERLPPWPPEVLAKFRRGDDRERDLIVDLTRAGRDSSPEFRILGQQERYELKDHKGRTAIVGKVDARLELDDRQHPIEIKSWAQTITARIESFSDVLSNPWTRPGAFQLLSYLWGAGEELGFLILDRSGLPKLIPVTLHDHLDEMEEFLSKAERVLDHLQAGTLPDYITDLDECRRCPWFGGDCNPPTSSKMAIVLSDPELESRLLRREELKAAAKEFDELDTVIKRDLRGVESGIAGPFQIVGQWQKSSRVELPEDLKKQFTKTDPKGRFRLEITRLT